MELSWLESEPRLCLKNGQVQASDKNTYFNAQVGQSGYREADFDLNGEVQALDKDAYFTKK